MQNPSVAQQVELIKTPSRPYPPWSPPRNFQMMLMMMMMIIMMMMVMSLGVPALPDHAFKQTFVDVVMVFQFQQITDFLRIVE